jgi:uncharacterized protein (TIGR02246 family)
MLGWVLRTSPKVSLKGGTPAMNARSLLAVPLAAALTIAACDAGDNEDRPAAPAAATSQSTPTAADEAAVRRLLDQINQAWERGDAVAYASHHTPDADLVDFRGVHAAGRQAIIDLLQPAFDGVLRDTRVEAQIVDLRFLSSDVAIFHTEGKIAPVGEDSVQTFVATKGAGGWQIAAFQNTRKQDPGGA